MINNLHDFKFIVTEDMNNAFIEILLIKEMLNNRKNNEKKRKLLEQQFAELRIFFIEEFKKNNVKQRKQYNKIINE